MHRHALGVFILIAAFQILAPNLCVGQETPPQPVSREQAIEIANQVVAETVAEVRDTHYEQLLEIAEEELTQSRDLLYGLAAVIGIAGVLGAFLGYLGLHNWEATFTNRFEKRANQTMEEMKTRTKEMLDVLSTNYKNAQPKILIEYSRFYLRFGFMEWEVARTAPADQRSRLLSSAIRDTEGALYLNPPNERLLTDIKSNLAYYYAELLLQDKRDLALTYAREAAELVPKYGQSALNWLANYGYVRKQFASTPEERDAANSYLKELSLDYPVLTAEVDDYLKES